MHRNRLRITRRDLERAMSYGARDLVGRAKDIVTSKPVMEQAQSGIAAFGYGMLEGAKGPIKVGPVAADLLGAVVLHGLAFSGYLGGHTATAHNVAQGLLDGHLARVGIGLGAAWAEKKYVVSGTNPRGSYHIGAPGRAQVRQAPRRGPLTEAEIAAIAQQMR